MPHFFVEKIAIQGEFIKISDKENYNHIARSLHMKVGEKLLIVDDEQIQYETVIKEITSNTIISCIEKSYPSKRVLPINIYLAQSVLKKEAQTDVIKKACELGVKGIYPIITDNSTIKKSHAVEKIEKYNKLSYEASKQCERPDIAPVYDVTDLESIINNNEFNIKIACVEKNAAFTLKTYLNTLSIGNKDKILVIIGPEGGFSQREFEILKNSNIAMVSLGNLILRADTAVIAALSNIIYGLCNE